jgi:hypothetical protein
MHAQDQSFCVTVKVAPAIVMLPVLSFLLEFAAALYPTVPLPMPVAPDVIVIQAALLLAVHRQTPGVDTATVPVAAAAEIVTLVGVIE